MQQANRQKLGILIIVLGLIVLLLIIYFGFLRKASETTTPSGEQTVTGQLPGEPETGTTTPSDKPRNYQQYDISQEPVHQTDANDLAKMAMAFAERFGSYSNQSNYGNFTDLKIFMTDSLKDWVDTYVAGLKEKAQDSNSYYGISTKALTSEVNKFDNAQGQASITVATQRRESTAQVENSNTYIQNIRIDMLKINGEWLVDSVYWEK